MPSQKVLEQKQKLVEDLRNRIVGTTAGVVVSFKGISVADDTDMRRELREAGVEYTVVKNTMLSLALQGTDFEAMQEVLTGSTALAVSPEDPIAAAKILAKYADKIDSFTLKAGYLDGKVLDAEGIGEIAKLPGKEELLTMLCIALNGNIRGLAVALNAVAEQGEDGAEVAAEEAPAEEAPAEEPKAEEAAAEEAPAEEAKEESAE